MEDVVIKDSTRSYCSNIQCRDSQCIFLHFSILHIISIISEKNYYSKTLEDVHRPIRCADLGQKDLFHFHGQLTIIEQYPQSLKSQDDRVHHFTVFLSRSCIVPQMHYYEIG